MKNMILKLNHIWSEFMGVVSVIETEQEEGDVCFECGGTGEIETSVLDKETGQWVAGEARPCICQIDDNY